MNPLLIRRRGMMEAGGGVTPNYGTLIHHWSGEDAPNGTLWVDRVGSLNWTLTNAVHNIDNYYFSNPQPYTSSSYASTLPGKMDGFVVVADAEIYFRASQTQYVFIDLCCVGQVTDGRQGMVLDYGKAESAWICAVKLNGNVSTQIGTMLDSPNDDTWVRHNYVFGVFKDAGVYKGYMYISGIGELYYNNLPYENNQWNGNWYLGRSFVTINNSRKFATTCKIYDLKVYDGNI